MEAATTVSIKSKSGTLQVGDHTTGDAHDVGWRSAELVVPCSWWGPHLVVLQHVRIYEHAQLLCVTKGWHATVGL